MRRRITAPHRNVPYLPEKHIEQEAALLLAEYGQKHGEVTVPPIPVDEIVELHLGLAFEMMDLCQVFGVPDVHGALWLKERRVGVDKSPDPADFPRKAGRYRFTLAHETGHWRLHRKHYVEDPHQGSLFVEGLGKPSYICRSSEAKKPVEWQANCFAANLLMPREMVVTAWQDWRGDLATVSVQELDRLPDEPDEHVMETFCRPLADQFHVSGQAMRIRLEKLGLLTRGKESTLF